MNQCEQLFGLRQNPRIEGYSRNSVFKKVKFMKNQVKIKVLLSCQRNSFFDTFPHYDFRQKQKNLTKGGILLIFTSDQNETIWFQPLLGREESEPNSEHLPIMRVTKQIESNRTFI